MRINASQRQTNNLDTYITKVNNGFGMNWKWKEENEKINRTPGTTIMLPDQTCEEIYGEMEMNLDVLQTFLLMEKIPYHLKIWI